MKTENLSFDFVKECRKELKKNFKGIEAFSYGYCCNSDYYDGKAKSQINDNDYVDAKIYKGGLNNMFHYNKWHIGKRIYYNWKLTNFTLREVIEVMRKVATRYGYRVLYPVNEQSCIIVERRGIG